MNVGVCLGITAWFHSSPCIESTSCQFTGTRLLASAHTCLEVHSQGKGPKERPIVVQSLRSPRIVRKSAPPNGPRSEPHGLYQAASKLYLRVLGGCRSIQRPRIPSLKRRSPRRLAAVLLSRRPLVGLKKARVC